MKKVWLIRNIFLLFLLLSMQAEATAKVNLQKHTAGFPAKKVIINDPFLFVNKKAFHHWPQPTQDPRSHPDNRFSAGVNLGTTTPSLLPPNSCNLDSIRSKLTKAGNVELLGLDNTCSLYFINPNKMSGPAAQAYAKTFGANLISIQSAAENLSLGAALANQGYGNDVVWIGLGDQIIEGTFEWYDGSTSTYTNWKLGEPNNSGDEDCTQIFSDGSWNDLNCDGYNSLSVIEVSLCPVTTISASKTDICSGDTTILNTKTILGAPVYKYSWVSDPPGFTSTEESPKVTPAITTTYSVTSTDRYGCVAVNTVTIKVSTLIPAITPSGPTTFCAGDSITLTASVADTYEWSTGATTQSIKVGSSGVYIVKLKKGACSAALKQEVVVLPKPKAAYENTVVCLGTATTFTDKSVGAVVWGWNFGDGTPTVLTQNPKHTYAKAGIYKVTLGVAAIGNCVDSIQQMVTVHDTPVASFFSLNSCSKDSIYFENTTTSDPSTNITGYLYNFGDGKTSTLPDVSHLYAKSGIYKVVLTVTTADGCVGTSTVKTIVDDSPKAIASGIENICESDTAKFINKSTMVAGKIATYIWDFGDGSPLDSTVWNPTHNYTAGTYTVTLALISDKGCTDTLKQAIEVYPAVKADFTAADVCLHEPTVFKNLSTGPIIIYNWDFNDGNTSADEEPTHTYAQPKTYTVILSISSAKNCKSKLIKKVAVHELPVAKFKALNVCDGKPVVFTNLSTITGSSTIDSTIWNFGDGSAPETTFSSQHLYTAVSQYDVMLKIRSNFGCADSITKKITVNPNPVVTFSASDTAGCHPFKTSFTNMSSISSGKIIKWLWEFGNINSKSDLKDPPTHIFKNTSNTDPVKYTIKLTATSDSGCVTTVSKMNYITVFPKPRAAFTLDPRETLVTNPVISFKNLSIGADSCTWAFDNIGSSDLYNPPPFSFVDTGTYKVTLIAMNSYGCADTTDRFVVIEPDYVIYIPSSFTPNGDEVNDTFGAKGSFIMDYEMTIFDRWGGVVYETKDINLPWNGGFKGTNLPAEQAVYAYVIKIKGANKKNYSYKGIVTMLR